MIKCQLIDKSKLKVPHLCPRSARLKVPLENSATKTGSTTPRFVDHSSHPSHPLTLLPIPTYRLVPFFATLVDLLATDSALAVPVACLISTCNVPLVQAQYSSTSTHTINWSSYSVLLTKIRISNMFVMSAMQ